MFALKVYQNCIPKILRFVPKGNNFFNMVVLYEKGFCYHSYNIGVHQDRIHNCIEYNVLSKINGEQKNISTKK
jgi:hypothetical protein